MTFCDFQVFAKLIRVCQIFFATARLGAALILFNYAYTDSEFVALLKAISKWLSFDFAVNV